MKQIFLFFLVSFSLYSEQISLIQAPLKKPIRAEIYNEMASIDAKKPFWLLIKLSMDDGWHTYWKNPGSAGASTKVEWKLPKGFQLGQNKISAPQKFDSPFGLSFGYKDQTFILQEVIPNIKEITSIEDQYLIEATISWIGCFESCVPGRVTKTDTILLSNESLIAKEHIELFTEARKTLTVPFNKAQITKNQNTIVLQLKQADLQKSIIDKAFFFPEKEGIISLDKEQIFQKDPDNPSDYQLIIPLEKNSVKNQLLKEPIKGVLSLTSKDKEHIHLEINQEVIHHLAEKKEIYQEPIEQKNINQSQSSKKNNSESMINLQDQLPPINTLLLFAFIGGLILNLMPCVLPVISFKVMHFMQMAEKKRSVCFKHGLSFSLGVVLSFIALASILVLFNEAGKNLGWGFQLQHPLFIGALSLLLFMMALSFFGVFEMGGFFSSWAGSKNSTSKGYLGSFFSGILATAIATPCTGPFLGTVIGASVLLSSFEVLMLFLSIGLGMALPYLFLSLFPELLRILPKPGAWMLTFKELMGFFLILTVLWLLWVFNAQTGGSALFLLITSFTTTGFGCWIYGKWGGIQRGKIIRFFGKLLALLILSFSIYLMVMAANQPFTEVKKIQTSSKETIKEWISFSPEKLKKLRLENRAVFVDFTAKWCLLCQANKVVLHLDEIEEAFEKKGVVKMIADWTMEDEVITEELRRFGRNGVPLYLFYAPGKEAVILPQTLSIELLYETLDFVE